MKNPRNIQLLENISAISAEFHTHKDFRQFYEKYRDEISGFPGIWRFCVTAGQAFRKAEGRKDNFEWIDAIMGYVDNIIQYALVANTQGVPKLEQHLEQWAADAIHKAGYKNQPKAPQPQPITGYCIVVEDEDQEDGDPPMFLTKNAPQDGDFCAYDPGDYENVRLFKTEDEAKQWIVGHQWSNGDNVWIGFIENNSRVDYNGRAPMVVKDGVIRFDF